MYFEETEMNKIVLIEQLLKCGQDYLDLAEKAKKLSKHGLSSDLEYNIMLLKKLARNREKAIIHLKKYSEQDLEKMVNNRTTQLNMLKDMFLSLEAMESFEDTNSTPDPSKSYLH